MRSANGGDPVEYYLQRSWVERRHNFATRIDSLRQFEPQIVRADMQWHRRLCTRLPEIAPVLAPKRQHIGEAGGRDQHDRRLAQFEQRVGRNRGAVTQARDLAGADPFLVEKGQKCCGDRVSGIGAASHMLGGAQAAVA